MTTMDEVRAGSAERPDCGGVTPQGVELRHLRYFVALADAGTFTHAAEQMFIAQPTLSQQIRRLEEMVGTPLLQRRREGVRLTEAGSVLLEESRAVLSRVDHGVSRTRQAAGLDVVHGPRRLSPVTYDAWLAVLREVNPRFEFTDPPFRRLLPITLAFAASTSRPTAVLTGPHHRPGDRPGPAEEDPAADPADLVRARIDGSPLTAAAALAWSGDLPRLLQQVLFDTADGVVF